MPTGPARHPVGEPPVSVAALLARNGEAPGVPAPREPDLSTVDTGQLFLAELSRREGRPEDEPLPARPLRARLVPALVAVLLLGAVTATGLVARAQPRPDRAVAAAAPVPWPQGADALRPAVLRGLAPPGPGEQPAPWDGFVDAPPAVEAAYEFFEAAGTSQESALDRLDRPLHGDDAAFTAEWDAVETVDVVEATALSSGEVQVVTALQYDDGFLVAVHRLTVRTDGPDPALITGAQLLSVSGG